MTKKKTKSFVVDLENKNIINVSPTKQIINNTSNQNTNNISYSNITLKRKLLNSKDSISPIKKVKIVFHKKKKKEGWKEY